MTTVVTGSSGHLGEALVRTLRTAGDDVVGVDRRPSPWTDRTVPITDGAAVREVVDGADAVVHTAALHKPHVGTHDRRAFVDVNVTGTLTLLEAAADAGVGAFVLTSTTSAFGQSLSAPDGGPAVWVTEATTSVARNVYGATKTAAEDLARVVHHRDGLPVVVLRTSRFFPEADDDPRVRAAHGRDNHQANELLHRRVDLADVVAAHHRAVERAPVAGFGRYVISATTPFARADRAQLAVDAPAVLARRFPDQPSLYADRGWEPPATIGRVYVNDRARRELGWRPEVDFARVLDCLRGGTDWRSDLARTVGAKGYHHDTDTGATYPFDG